MEKSVHVLKPTPHGHPVNGDKTKRILLLDVKEGLYFSLLNNLLGRCSRFVCKLTNFVIVII